MLCQRRAHRIELRSDQRRMFLHLGLNSGEPLEEPRMAQLIQLVRSNGLKRHLTRDIRNIRCRCGKRGQPGTGN